MATDGGATTDAGAAKDGDAAAGFVCGPRAGDTVLATTDSSRTFKNRAGAVTPHSLYLPPGYGSAGNTQRQRSPVVCHLPGKGLNSTHAGAQVQNVSANCEDARCTPSLHIAPVIIIFPDGHAAEDDVHDLMAFVDATYRTKPDRVPTALLCVGWRRRAPQHLGGRQPSPPRPQRELLQHGEQERRAVSAGGDVDGAPQRRISRASLIDAGITNVTGEPEYHDYSSVVTTPAHDLKKALDANGTDRWSFLAGCGW